MVKNVNSRIISHSLTFGQIIGGWVKIGVRSGNAVVNLQIHCK